MRAVNLIPADQRRRGTSISTGAPFLALTGGLVVVLIAVALFVVAHNRVESRRTQLAAANARTAQWSGAAGSYTRDLATNQQRQATIVNVKNLVGQQANWSELLGQLARVMPRHSALTSLSATASVGAADASGTSSSSGAAATTTTSTATPTTTDGTTTDAGSSIQLAACAASQSVVAESLVAFRRITGVSQVSLGSTTRSGGSGGSSCGYPVSYSVTLAFEPPTFASGDTTEAPVGDTSATTASGGSQ